MEIVERQFADSVYYGSGEEKREGRMVGEEGVGEGSGGCIKIFEHKSID